MKKLILIIILLTGFNSFSQDFEKKAERIKALRIAYISEKLNLTPQEAEKFWPIFNQFLLEQKELHKKNRALMKELKVKSKLPEKDLENLLLESEKIEIEMFTTRQNLSKKLKGIIPSEKIILLKSIEEDFKKTILKRMPPKNHKRPE